MGHKGILLAAHYEKAGFANLSDPVWAPFLATAQEMELSINFHIGFSQMGPEELASSWSAKSRGSVDAMSRAEISGMLQRFVPNAVGAFLSNVAAISEVIMRGLCQRYPELQFVSVESGFGYIPFVLQAMDWQAANAGIDRIDPPLDLLPSEYFRRQFSATFWYEQPYTQALIDLQDNVLFETDFPHPTSLAPGPHSSSPTPRDAIRSSMGDLPHDVARKILHDNAARLYHLQIAGSSPA
jgi:predicted TIM-barrel fold metal-dependent hydrolase